MKKLIIIFLATVLFFGCSKNDETPTAAADQLPPATQTGANKVGCLVNGQVLLPYQKNPFGPPAVVCFYQFVNNQFHFSLGFSNDKISNGLRNINIASINIELQQGQTYQLKLDNGNSAFASYVDFAISAGYYTNNINTGELKITKLDQTNAIISGTFWFNAVRTNGAIAEIKEGRFDMQYSQ